jgi:hypothetical protein
MDRLNWIKELVTAEQNMEDSGIIDFQPGFDHEKHLQVESVDFLKDLRAGFFEASSAFNQLKGSTLGQIKLYGISKTESDFMLFRNGFKLIFSLKQPGTVSVRMHYLAHPLLANSGQTGRAGADEDLLVAKAGAFGDLQWMFQGQPIKLDYMVKYYLSRFVRESAK